jgi:hypothetical protein
MKTFSSIVVSVLFLFAYAPAFAHGSGHGGMNGINGMNGNNSHHMTTVTQDGYTTKINTQGNNTTKTTTTGHLGFGQKFFLKNEERGLLFEIHRLRAELLRLETLGVNSPRVIALQNQLQRDGLRLFQIKTKLGQIVVL